MRTQLNILNRVEIVMLCGNYLGQKISAVVLKIQKKSYFQTWWIIFASLFQTHRYFRILIKTGSTADKSEITIMKPPQELIISYPESF